MVVCNTEVVAFATENESRLSPLEARRDLDSRAPDAELIRGLCRDLIAESGVEPPVPVAVLASYRGIHGVIPAYIESAGMLSREQGRFIVRVRATDALARRRFSALHETGHTFMPGFADKPRYRCNPAESRNTLEELCDIAAAELLYPYEAFLADLVGRSLDLETVEALADRYAGSIESTALRLVELAAVPVVLIALQQQLKPTQVRASKSENEALRVAYSRVTGSWPFIPRHKSVPADGPFGRAFDGEVVNEASEVLEPFVGGVGEVHISARRYGHRVLALVQAA